jgi:hypothetical protein
MLGDAAERRFVTAQLGMDNSSFPTDHLMQVERGISVIFERFWSCVEDEEEAGEAPSPASPYAEDLVDFRHYPFDLQPWREVETCDLCGLAGGSPSSAATPSTTSRRSMSLKNLIHPEPSPEVNLKRKRSGDPIAPLPDPNMEEQDDVDDASPPKPGDWLRAMDLKSDFTSRTRKDIRFRGPLFKKRTSEMDQGYNNWHA